VGNRTTYTATITQTTVITYKYPSATLRTGDAADRLVRVGDVDYTWDNLGRLLDDGIYTYTWDAAGRLITVSAGVDVLGFRYDSASQHRIRRKSTMRKKISLTIGLVIVLGVVGLATYFLRSDSPPPPTTEEIISQVLRSELPEFIRGKTGYARSGDVNIWYESIKPHGAAKGAVLILAGISSDALMWSPRFLDALGDAGYQVIRYDYRGTGMSDWIKDWDSRNPYSIQDMVNDGIAVLDAMGIKEAHVVGVSMGGMVAQQMAIDHPDRVLSLTSIMSSGDIADPNLPSTPADVVQEFLAISMEFFATKSERNAIESHIAFRTILMGDSSYALDVKTISEQVLYNLRKRQGYNLQAYLQHQTAVLTSGSRYDELQTIDTPTLIIHGKSDPLIPIEHGMKCADLIPHADTLWIDGLGHDLPDKYVDVIVEKMVMNFQRAE
jgi:pimeloyl-ACP methyl ester carboxylesterase